MLQRMRWGASGLGLVLVTTTAAWAGPGDKFAALAGEELQILDEMPAGRTCAPAGRVCVFPVQDAPKPAEERTESAKSSDRPWMLELVATLAKPAHAGNAVFLVFDADDPSSVARNEVVTLRQAPIRAGRSLAARFSLSPNEGFRDQHRYLIRIVQLLRGKQVLLAAGDVKLMR